MIIKNGYMLDPKSGKEGTYHIRIKDDKIMELIEADESEQAGWANEAAQDVSAESGEEVIDASGLVVAPGLVDVHVHFRDPGFTGKEDIHTGAKAAAKGGFTTVVLMANTKPAVDNLETLQYVLEKGRTTGIHVETCANVTMGLKGKELTPMEELRKAGAAGFTDDGIPILDADLLRQAMEKAAELHVPISLHEEDPAYITNNGVNKGKVSEYYGIGGSSRQAEIVMVQRDLEIALETGAVLDIQHISTKEAVDLVRQAKKKGSNIHAEAAPHHFTLTEEAVIKYGTLAKMNPPLREEADRLAVIEGLKDGTIDMIATDHAPHMAEEKAKPITEAPSGITGLETSLSLGITQLVEKGEMSLMHLMRLMSTNPAAMYGLDAGHISVGGPADLVLFDPKAKVIPTEYASKATNTPFTGWELTGKVVKTICAGKVVYEG